MSAPNDGLKRPERTGTQTYVIGSHFKPQFAPRFAAIHDYSGRILNAPAQRHDSQLILEGIVTSRNADGSTNVAPMGPVVDRQMSELRLRPFDSSTTFQNLARTRCGVFHVTDDALQLAQAAIGQLELPTMFPLDGFAGDVIKNACRWYAFEVDTISDSRPRVEIGCRVVDSGDMRPFLGWNRAMHSVLEAAILATRVGMLPAEDLAKQFQQHRQVIDKTASDLEREAFRVLERYVAEQGASLG